MDKAVASARDRALMHGRKDAYIAWRGSACERCGVELRRGLAEFHHPDPSLKDLPSKRIFRRPLKEAVKELATLEMLCTVCHREIHDQWEERGQVAANTPEAEETYQRVYRMNFQNMIEELA